VLQLAYDTPFCLAIAKITQVAPNLPQPVVKVPTSVLARSLDTVDVSSSSTTTTTTTTTTSSRILQPGDDPFIPPEAYVSQSVGGQRDTPAGDVWACGVLLLSLLGGRLNPQVYSIGISPKAARVRDTDLFEFPGQQQAQAASSKTAQHTAQHNSAVSTDLKGLLTGMLQPCPNNRITLQCLQQHSWFAEGLPPTARTMTQRFIEAGHRGRVCRTSAQEINALVLAAAAGPEALGSSTALQQLRSAAAAAKAQSQVPQQVQQRPELQLLGLQGPVSAELLYGLQLQLHVLQQTCLQLQGLHTAAVGSSSKRPSASNLTEILAAQHAAAYAAACVSSMECAVRKLRVLRHLRHLQQLLLRGSGSSTAWPGLQGLALQLQYACSAALFSTSRLQLLLRSTETPYVWKQLHTSIPAGDTKGVGQWEHQQHMLKLQVYLLLQAQQCLHSLWVCTATAAALADACMLTRRRQRRETPAGRAPHVLTAVLGPLPRVLQQQLPLAAIGLLQGSRAVLGQLVLSLLMVLVHANKENMADAVARFQKQEWRRITRRAAVQLVNCIEELKDVQVDKQPCADASGSASSCVTYAGQVAQAGKVLVIALAGLLSVDPTQQLPKERLKAREELFKKAHPVPKAYRCVFCAEMMQDAVHAEDGRDYCAACIERYRRTCAAAGEPAMSPFNKTVELKSTPTPNFNLRENIADKCRELDQQLSKMLQQEQLQWTDAGSAAAPASQHLGLAHAPQPKSPGSVSTLQQLMVKLQAAGLLSGVPAASSSSSSSSTAAAASSTHQQQQQDVLEPLSPILAVCSNPPLLVLPPPLAGTLQQWISSRASTLSSRSGSDTEEFTSAWARDLPWPLLLQLLGDVAAGLNGLHQQQPAVVHGGVHAAAVHLLQQLPSTHQQQPSTQQQLPSTQQEQQKPSSSQQQQLSSQQQQQGSAGRLAQLSLVNLLAQLSTVSSCHPFLAAPESQLSSAAATPAADVYGFGMLMFQITSGWLPQQYKPGSNDQVSAVLWSRKMLGQASSTSPLAAVQTLAAPQPPPTPPQQQPQQHGQAPRKDSIPAAMPPLLSADWTPYGRHLLSSRALQSLPSGYVALMEQCLHSVAPARPCMQAVAARLQDIAQDRVAGAQQQQQQRSLMLEAMRVVEQHRAAASAAGV
jgi:hypothetical protein